MGEEGEVGEGGVFLCLRKLCGKRDGQKDKGNKKRIQVNIVFKGEKRVGLV